MKFLVEILVEDKTPSSFHIKTLMEQALKKALRQKKSNLHEDPKKIHIWVRDADPMFSSCLALMDAVSQKIRDELAEDKLEHF